MTRTHRMLLAAAMLLAAGQALAQGGDVATGKYLVDTSGCHDCHTPWIMGANGPEPDMSRALSGHPQDMVISAPGKMPEGWVGAMNATNTAWTGPWGVSFTANLTPDPETGIWREMTEEQFIQALRTGRHLGQHGLAGGVDGLEVVAALDGLAVDQVVDAFHGGCPNGRMCCRARAC